MSRTNDVLQGTRDLLVRKALAQLGRMRGFGLALHIQQVSNEPLRVDEGSLYPALRRIEQTGWIKAARKSTENNRRAFREYRARNTVFTGVAATIPLFPEIWTGDGEPRVATAGSPTQDFCSVPGIRPVLGRVLRPSEFHDL